MMGGRGSSSMTLSGKVTAPSKSPRQVAIAKVQGLIEEGTIVAEQESGDFGDVLVWLRGNTYENREAIKEAGFNWNRVHRLWEYKAAPSYDDEMLMSFAKELTTRKLERAEYLRNTTKEQRDADDRAILDQWNAYLDQRQAARRAKRRGLV